MEFSVLMSVYYKEKSKYLKESIHSLLEQTIIPNEILIVKDGKLTDELEEVLNSFKLKNSNLFNFVELEQNQGLGVALNVGLKKCKYNLVARMDSDDICEKDRFEKQINIFKKNANIDIVGTNVIEFTEDMKKIISSKSVPESDIEIKKFLKKRNPINHMSVMYKKDKVVNVNSYEKCPYFEDYYLWCKLARNGANFYNIQENLVKVRGGTNMYKRRGGKEYSKNIIEFEHPT